jgi:hypothetical protein
VKRLGTRKEAAAVRWYAAGFALGAAGASVAQRKGKPRLRAQVAHWRQGIADGRFAASMFVGAFAARK